MMPIQEIGYLDFIEKAKQKLPRHSFPIEGVLELTFRCVLKCQHCYTACNQYADQEMTAPEWIKLLDEAADLGTLDLLITGGDPMLKKDLFKEVYLHAKKKGMWVTVYTSGNLIDEKWAQFFAKAPPYRIEITLYGATEKTYEAITQIKGSYKRCMDGIEWLEKYRVPFALKAVAMDINKHEIHACRKIAETHGLGSFRLDAGIHPKLDGSDIPLARRLTPKEVVELDLADPKRKISFEKTFHRPLKRRNPDEIKNFHCAAGSANFYANPYGQLQVCTIVPGKEHQYDWRKGGSLKEAFYEFFPKLGASKPKRAQRCHQCNLWEVCDMCAGWAMTVHGDLETPVDWVCEVTHRRAIAFGADSKLFDQSMMYQRIMEGKTFPETIVPEEGFHGSGSISLPTFKPASPELEGPKKSCCNDKGGCCR